MNKIAKSKQQSRNRILLEIKTSLDRAIIFAETDSPGFKESTLDELKKIKRLLTKLSTGPKGRNRRNDESNI